LSQSVYLESSLAARLELASAKLEIAVALISWSILILSI